MVQNLALKLGSLLLLLTLLTVPVSLVFKEVNVLISLLTLSTAVSMGAFGLIILIPKIIMGFRRLESKSKWYLFKWLLGILKAVAIGIVFYIALRVLTFWELLDPHWAVVISYSLFYAFFLLSTVWLLKASDRVSRIYKLKLISTTGRIAAVLIALIVLAVILVLIGYHVLAYVALASAYIIVVFFLIVVSFSSRTL
ncbi:MAG: hypothetical protein QXM56_01945 [Acidilobaceae archaeon]